MNNQILTTREIANRWGCSQEFVRSLIQNGRLRPKERGEKRIRYRVSLEEVLKTEHQLAQSYIDRKKITLVAIALGINRRYARQYLDLTPERKEDTNTAKGR